MVAEGAVTLTTIALLRPYLTADNHRSVLEGARHRSKREVEHQVACLAPKAEVTALVRRLPAPTPGVGPLLTAATAAMPPSAVAAAVTPSPAIVPLSARSRAPTAEPRSQVAPVAADRYLLRVTLSAETHARLRRAQSLMGHRVPGGDPAVIIIFSRRFDGTSGPGTKAGVPSSEGKAAARKPAVWSFITSSRLREEDQRPPGISRFGAGPITATRVSWHSALEFVEVPGPRPGRTLRTKPIADVAQESCSVWTEHDSCAASSRLGLSPSRVTRACGEPLLARTDPGHNDAA